MYLKKIEIKNFRLWKNTSIELEQQSTVIVGKNNTGKTSFMDLMLLFVKNQLPTFDDYPLEEREKLYKQVQKYLKQEIDFNNLSSSFLLPSAKMYVDYSLENEDENLGFLSPFIIDTDDSITEVCIDATYMFVATQEQFDELFPKEDLKHNDIESEIRDQIERNFSYLIKLNFFTINPRYNNKKRKIDYQEFKDLFPIFPIKAERTMDESEISNDSPLKPILTTIFNPQLDRSMEEFKEEVEKLNLLCKNTNQKTQQAINESLNKIVQNSIRFGYPSGEDQKLIAKSHIELEKQILKSVDLYYNNTSGNEALPSTYNGLGYKNLVKIELQLINFANQLENHINNSIPLVFIEEPESHMHPQMQQRFIEYIEEYCKKISETKKLQIIITTHSSHIVNSTKFEKIRYLQKDNCTVSVKNLNDFCKQKDSNKEFLEKYLTLNKCDLFFADKAILIEGTAERLLIPDMIEKLDKAEKFKKNDITLRSQYYTLIEVGGAYAFKFIPFMRFLKIPALIITDIDSILKDRKKCYVSEGNSSSNATINHWLSKILSKKDYSFNDIKELSDTDKTRDNIHIEFQVEENGLCGRSLEEAIKNANRELFSLEGNLSESDIDYNPSKDGSKTDFAMNLIFKDDKQNYNIPKYIEDGLIWLDSQPNGR